MIKQLRSLALVFIGLLCSFNAKAQFPYSESFKNSTAPGSTLGGSAYLTAAGTGVQVDPNGAGYLRLTNSAGVEAGYAYSSTIFPSSNGISATFEYYSHTGSPSYQADGISFFLFDASANGDAADPANGYPNAGFGVGANGGSLGYAQAANFGLPGARKGFIGIGFDEFGNYRADERGKPGTNVAGTPTQEWVTVRGDGYGIDNNATNYEVVAEVQTATVSGIGGNFPVQGSVDGRTAGSNGLNKSLVGYRRARVDIVPNGQVGTSQGFIINVWITEGTSGGGIVHRVINNLNYIPNNGVTTGAALIPATLSYGFGASTGGFRNAHEIRSLDLVVPSSVGIVPVAVPDVATTNQGQPVTFDITSNDYDSNGNFQLNLASVDLDPFLSGQQTTFTNTEGTYTYAIVSGVGKVTFSPVLSFSGAATPINYKISDTGNDIDGVNYFTPSISNSATISIVVNDINSPPSGTDATITMLEDATRTFTASDFGFTDQNDVPPNILQAVKISTLPALGSLRLSGVPVTAGQFIPVAEISNLSYSPAANAIGTTYTTFTFQVQDNGGTANSGVDLDPTPNTITINVIPANTPPSITNVSKSGSKNTLLTFTTSAFTSKFSDPENAPLVKIKFPTLPDSLTGAVKLNGAPIVPNQEILLADIPGITFTPANEFTGTVSFTWNGSDESSYATTPASVSISIIASNTAPIITNITKSGAVNTSITFTLGEFVSKFTDTEGNALSSIQVVSLPPTGTLKLDGTSVTVAQIVPAADITNLIYVPATGFTGMVSFAWNASDGTVLANSSALVNITIISGLSFNYTETFKNSSAPAMAYGGNQPAALTAAGGPDSEGAGYLRLTNNGASQIGFAYNSTPFPSSAGISASFEYYSHSGTGPYQADGISFFLFDSNVLTEGANAIYQSPGFTIGGPGSALGYANFDGSPGLRRAFIGLGLDEFGNFARYDHGKGTASADDQTQENVTLRGDGNGTASSTNYRFLTYAQANTGASPFKVQGQIDGRTKGALGLTPFDLGYRKAKLELTPSVAGGFIVNVWITEGNPLGPIEHHVINNYQYNPTGAIPANLSYGFAASTGGFNNIHEIRNLSISTPQPQVIESPTITLSTPNAQICSGTASTQFAFSTTGSPNQYSIVWDSAATTAGLANVSNSTLTTSPLTIASLGTVAPGIYSGTITVKNSGTGMSSTGIPFSITINTAPAAPAAITGNAPLIPGSSITLANATPSGSWTSSTPAVATISGAGVVTAIMAGNTTITYTITNASGCTSSVTAVLTVDAGPVLTFPYNESFKNATASGMVLGGTDPATLTGNGITDANGAGYLRLTNNGFSQLGYAYNTASFPSANGLTASFEYYSHTGSSNYQADGLSFFLFDSNVALLPASTTYPSAGFNIGGAGSALGYTNFDAIPGLRKAFFGMGLDEFGNFARFDHGKSTASGDDQTQENVTLRGHGDGEGGSASTYKFLTYAKTNTGAAPFKIQGQVDGRIKGASGLTEFDLGYRKAKVELTPNPTGGFYVNVWITEGNPAGGILHHVITNYLYNETGVIPEKLSYGFAASTGGFNNYHEIRNLSIDVPQVSNDTLSITLTNANPVICKDSPTATIPFSAVTPSANQYSIVWNAAALNAGLVNSSGTLQASPITINNLSNIPTGSYSGTLIVSNGTISSTGSEISLTINAKPDAPASITGNTSITIGSTSSLASATAGGAWTSSNPQIATVSGSTGLVTALSPGTTVITYTLINSSGCSASASTTVNITPGPSLTLPYSETFRNPSAPRMVYGGSPSALLTGNGTIDNENAGYLRLTNNGASQLGYAYNTSSFPANAGLNVSFEYYTHTGSSNYQADGMSFFLFDSNVAGLPAGDGYPNAGFNIGGPGSALGYANFNGTPGLRKAFLGVGFDEFGNFARYDNGKGSASGDEQTLENVTLRGDGNGPDGVPNNYKFLTYAKTNTGSAPFKVQGQVDGRTKGANGLTEFDLGYRKAKIDLTAAPGGYYVNVWITEGNPAGGILHHVITDYMYTPLNGLPANLSYGFAASTGGFNNYHEIRNLTIDAPAAPTMALAYTTPAVCIGVPNARIPYSAVTGFADKYSITWDAAAITAGLVNVTNGTLSGDTIVVNGLSGVAPGVYHATVKPINSNSGVSGSGMSITLTINELPTLAPIAGSSSVTINTTATLSNTTSGGLWTSSNTAVATINAADGIITALSLGTTTITYKVTNASGCVNSVTKTITVENLPQPAIISISPAQGPAGTVVTLNGNNLSGLTSVVIGGKPAIIISNTATNATALVMPGSVTGVVSVTNAVGLGTLSSGFTIESVPVPSVQQGGKLVGTGSVGTNLSQRYAVAISADGNTSIIGAPYDSNYKGAAWVFVRVDDNWIQQGTKLSDPDGVPGMFGASVALSADGNTAAIGMSSFNQSKGGVRIYTRTNGLWTAQGTRLSASNNQFNAYEGYFTSISADGNTVLTGGYGDDSNKGAAWVYVRSNGIWSLEGPKITVPQLATGSLFGSTGALSSDGNTAVIGTGQAKTGYIFVRKNGAWKLQGNSLQTGSPNGSYLTMSSAISSDGNTVVLGAPDADNNNGAIWVFTRTDSTWSAGIKIPKTDYSQDFARGVSISADGTVIMVSGNIEGQFSQAHVFKKKNDTWSMSNNTTTGMPEGGSGSRSGSIAMTPDGKTLIMGSKNGAELFVPGPVAYESTTVYNQTFKNSGAAYTTLGGNAIFTGGGIDAEGAGYLRLTQNVTAQAGYLYGTAPIPTVNGISASFEYYSHGGESNNPNYQADGLSFFLYDINSLTAPADPAQGYNSGFNIGASGGALGYAQASNFGLPGVRKGFIALGLDEFGNFRSDERGKPGTNVAGAPTQEWVVLRGDGNGFNNNASNYRVLAEAQATSPFTNGGSFTVQGKVNGRPYGLSPYTNGYRKARLDIVPNGAGTGFIVNVWITTGGSNSGTEHHMITNYNYIPVNGIPDSVGFGFGSSTGGFTNNHEVRNLTIETAPVSAVLDANIINPNLEVCEGLTYGRLFVNQKQSSPTTYSINWDATGLGAGLTNKSNEPVFNPNQPTSYLDITFSNVILPVGIYTANLTLKNTETGATSVSKTITVTVKPKPVVQVITGLTNLTVGQTTTLANATPGGLWVSSNFAVADVASAPNANNIGIVNAISAGSATISYIVNGTNGCSTTVSTTIVVSNNNLPITGTLPFSESFKNSTSTNAVIGGNGILTAGNIDPEGSGFLRLTNNSNNQFGYYQNKLAFPTSNGLTYTFDYYSYGGDATNANYQADGLSLFLYDSSVIIDSADVANGYSHSGFSIGGGNGSLGYANRAISQTPGLRKGFLALGLDEFGNFRTTEGGKSGVDINPPTQEWVTLRGDGNGISNNSTNYEVLTAVQTTDPNIVNGPFTVQGKVNGRSLTDASSSGYRSVKLELVPNGLGTGFKINVWVYNGTGSGTIYHRLITDYDYIPDGGVPANLSFGFASATGGFTNTHEVRNLQVSAPSTIQPSITLRTNTFAVCQGTPEVTDLWSGSDGLPNQFSIAWDATALSAGFTDITNQNFETAPMKITGLAGIASGTYTGTFTARNSSNGLSTTPQQITVIINPAPVVGPISGNNVVYTGNTIQLTNNTSGGIWSTLNPSVASVNASGVVTGVGPGLATIKYSLTNSSGCAASSKILVTVFASTSSTQFPSTTTYKDVNASNTLLGGSATLTASSDGNGNGYLRLTGNSNSQFGYARNTTAFPSGNGLIATFEYFSHSGSNSYQADGFSFFLYDPTVVNAPADPANGYSSGFNIGANGGALGYAQAANFGLPGLRKGFLGVGFDEFGNFRADERGKQGVNVNGVPTQEWVTLRGDGNGTANIPGNYELLTAVQTTDIANSTAIGGLFSVQGKIDGRTVNGGLTSNTVGRRKATVELTPLPTNTGYLVNVYIEEGTTSGPINHHVINNYSYTPTDGIPSQLAFGFAGSTGGFTNIHEIRNVTISVPQSVVVAPVAVNDMAVTIQNQAITVDITSNDYDGNGNATLDLLSVDLDNNTAGVQNSYTTLEGTYTYSAASGTGKVTFTPAPGFYGVTAPLGYTIKDNGIGTGIISVSNAAYISITVTPLQTITNVNTQDGAGDSPLFAVVPKTAVSEPEAKLDANNILSPNGDGKNDLWVIRNINLYPKNEITIVDRNGRTVYHVKNYRNDWNGHYNGSPLPEGTYYYIMDVGGKKPLKGFISIIQQ